MPCHSACVCRTWETVAASSSPASPRPCKLCWPPPQVQFFALFPLLLCALQPRSRGFRGRLAVAVTACILGGTAWRLAAVWRAPEPLEFPIADFATDTTAQHSWAAMLHATYLPTGARVAELAVGVAQGAMLTSPAALKALQRRCVGCGWLQQCACIAPFSIQCMHPHHPAALPSHAGAAGWQQQHCCCKPPTLTSWLRGRCCSAGPAPSPGLPAARGFRQRCCGMAPRSWRHLWPPPWGRCCWLQTHCMQQRLGC